MVLYLGFQNGAEIFFFYFFPLTPGGVFVFTLADPDVAEVVFGVGNYNNDLAGSDVLINTRGYFPEALAETRARRGIRWRVFCFYEIFHS